MGRRARPWFWTQRNEWCVTIDGERYLLGPDKDAAETKFHELMADPNRNVPSNTLVSIIELFLDWTLKHREKTTYDWYQHHLQSFLDNLTPKLLTVDKLKPHHVETWTEKLTGGGSYVRGSMTAITRALNWAEKKGHIDQNPIRRKLDKPKAGRREKVLTQEEYDVLLSNASKYFKDVLVVAWESGCRPQEITRVEARHVDSENGRWVFPEEESKGKKEKRIVYLSDKALEITNERMAKFPEGPLFRTQRGNPWDRCSFSESFTKLKTKIGKRYCLYNIRHTYITNGLKRGVDPVTMATLVGHADLTMIHRIYSHISQDSDHMRKMAMKAIHESAEVPQKSSPT
jgi:integrase